MNILITGASGFVGQHLISALSQNSAKNKIKIFGTRMNNTHQNDYQGEVVWLDGDLTDEAFVQQCIEISQPDQVYHLAAFASAGASFSNPIQTLVNNIKAQGLLLEAIKHSAYKPRILIVGSIEENGIVDPKTDINEVTKLNPVSPYAVSKIAQDFMGLQYFNSADLDIVRVRPSNHIGPGQSPSYVVSSWCRQVALIEANKQDPVLKVGNTAVIRDFTDVRDMVTAYVLALQKCRSGEVYVIGSGIEVELSRLLKILQSLSKVEFDIQTDKSLFRPNDAARIVVNANKFIRATSWKREYAFESTIRDILNYWRKSVAEEL